MRTASYLVLTLWLVGCGDTESSSDGSSMDGGADLVAVEGGTDGPPADVGLTDGPGPVSDQLVADGLPLDKSPPSPDVKPPTPDSTPPPADAGPINPNQDADGDKLPDGWEALFPGFDGNNPDSDGDKIPDGAEDEDKDGIPAALEWAAWSGAAVETQKPSPRHKDLLVELDYQKGHAPTAWVLAEAIEALAAVQLTNLDGKPGIALHVFIDEKDLPVAPMNESLGDRLSYLGAHGPKAGAAGSHAAEMVHVVFASTRPGLPSRGGDTIAASSQPAEKAGVLIYLGNLMQIFPTCTNPYPPKVSVLEATVSTLVHELGHTLQLGHDTSAGGGVNPYNIMSTDLGQCDLLKKRTRGVGNTDVTKGATGATGGPRFSKAAAQLMKLTNKISVEANKFEVGSGYEM